MSFDALARRFPRKRAFITGAGSGLGLALAQALTREGWSLGIFDHDLSRLTSVEGELAASGARIAAYPGDVTHADELTVAINTFAQSNDGLDVMINNAGVSCGGTMIETPLEDWHWITSINLMGVVHGSRAAIPHLQRNGSGLIINIASAAAFASAPGMIAYNASKAAVLSLSESLYNELRASRTQVSVVMPAFFRSGLLSSYRGRPELREKAQRLMEKAQYTAEQMAHDLLQEAGAGRIHIVLPGSARWFWRLKRWMPSYFLRRVLALRERARQAR